MELDMTKGRPLPVLLRFTLPLLVGNVFQQLYNMVDTVIVGRFVGAGALAAVGATGTIMFLITGFAQGITSGFAILTAQRYGAKDASGVKRSVANGMLLALFVTVILTAGCMIVMKPLLKIMNTPEDIFADAYTYIMIISGGIAASMFYNLFSACLRSVGNSQVPLFFLMFSACLNIMLDLGFIIRFDMGVAGAAFATVVSQAVSAALCGGYIFVKAPALTPETGQWRISGSDTKHQLSMGIPMALQFAITASGGMVAQTAVNMFGSEAVAAYTAAVKLEGLIEQGMVAMGQAVATYGGQNFGKGDLRRVRDGVRAAALAETVYAVLAAVVVCAALEPALGLFFAGEVDMAAMMPWARTFTYLCAAFFVPLSLIFVFRNVMQGCGYGFLPMMGGVVEMAARLAAAVLAMKMSSFVMACICCPAAWTSAALFLGGGLSVGNEGYQEEDVLWTRQINGNDDCSCGKSYQYAIIIRERTQLK